MAISASVIQVMGLIPPYFELAKRSGRVIGIDFWFLIIDYSGAFFSLMAVVAQQWFDALGASLYIACIVLETGIFVSQGIWLWRVRHVRREAKALGLGYDEYVKRFPEKLPKSVSEESVVDVEAQREKEPSSDTRVEEKAAAEKKEVASDAESTRSTLVADDAGLQLPPNTVIKP
jgi:hypothetical protein